MKLLISAFVLSFSLTALAQNKTAVDTIRDAYDAAATAATLQDFNHDNWTNCIDADVYSPMNTQQTSVRILDNNYPDQGPLFPGRTEHRVDVFFDPSLDQRIDAFFASSCIDTSNPLYFKQTLDGPGWTRMDIYGKTENGMLFFMVAVSPFQGPQAPMTPRVYGYCWNANSSGTEPPLPKPH